MSKLNTPNYPPFEQQLQKLISLKSKKIIELSLLNDEQKLKNYLEISQLELLIAHYEIENGSPKNAILNIYNSMKFFNRLGGYEEMIKKILLRAFLDDHFNDLIYLKLSAIIKIYINNTTRRLNPLLKKNIDFIIDEFSNNEFLLKRMNVNKMILYLLSKTPFPKIEYIGLPVIKISSYPLYSEEVLTYIDNLKSWKVYNLENKHIFPSKNYSIVKKSADNYRKDLISKDPNLYEKYVASIDDFSQWDSNKIEKWEKRTKILDYFMPGDIIT